MGPGGIGGRTLEGGGGEVREREREFIRNNS
jgi:hypothetical protein